MSDWLEWQIQKARREEMLREAQQIRFVQSITRRQRRFDLTSKLAAWLVDLVRPPQPMPQACEPGFTCVTCVKQAA